ncbi:alpha-amylase family glycosyl hydrolase [Weeksellaceae bacterium KMM 9713]|uniref:Alpha-amylase family glycosyl hydrolase n=1 Tax=Profundicola chukchiensis TaxID=2961959 RepID=A0A9X4N0Y8_9FLAO|nr:alpha-amylase family glycosyl hydrolase [Profundicola chukchiensis]MDG4946922.1 alpha-amylase family glycosyl hydrolase [Profundicola chukchiensis]
MKTLLILLLTGIFSFMHADTGIFQSYVILETNSIQYYDCQARTDNLDFNGNLGTFSLGQTFNLKGGEIKTWKNGNSDVTGGAVRYRIYPNGSPNGSFSSISLGFGEDLGNGDQRWATDNQSVPLLQGLSSGEYTLEIYFEAYTNEGIKYSNNDEANYKANFTYIDELILNDGAVTVSPSIPTRTDQITITLDAAGTDLETSTKVYFHSGVGEVAPGSTGFGHTIGNWGLDDGVGEMIDLGNNKWQIVLPSADAYFGLNPNDDAFSVNFLFRNTDGSKKEDFSGANYTFALQPGPYFLLENPTYSPYLVEVGQGFDISATAAPSASWTLYETDEIGNNINTINTQTGTSYNYTHILSNIDLKYFKLEANFGSMMKFKTFEVSAYSAPAQVSLPTGAKNGVNLNLPNTGEVTLVLHTPTTTTYNFYDSRNCEGTTSTATTAAKQVVHLIGDFNNWEIQENYKLNRDGDYWWITLNPIVDFPTPNVGEYVYQYLIDGEIRIGDPYANKISDPDDQYIDASVYPNLIPYPHGLTIGRASVLQLNPMEYDWQVPNFEREYERNELNIYELHFRDFTEEGTYKAATEKLDYIKELGINTIHVMPVSEFEGNNSWGYNPNYYFAADKAYGTANDLKEFIDEAHKRGIAVVNDLVLNHAFYSNPNAMLYWDKVNNRPAADNPWFNPVHKGVYDEAGHWGADWNHASEHTQQMMDDILEYWIKEFKFDGFRFDFTKGLTQADPNSNDPWASGYDVCRIAILKRMVNEMWEIDSAPIEHYAIFEHLANDSEDAELANHGILMWSGAGPQEDWVKMAEGNEIKGFEKSLYSTRNFTYANYMSYMESHDEERVGFKVKNYGVSNDNTTEYLANRLKLVAAFNLLMPGPRMVWQFGELGYDISIDYNGRTGDKPSAWELSYDANDDRKEIYNLYSHILNFRNQYDLYSNGGFDMRNNMNNTLQWQRTMSGFDSSENVQVISIGNFDPLYTHTVQPGYFRTGTWFKYNGDPSIDGTPYNVDNTNDNYELYVNDPIYVLSNADIIPPVFNVEPTVISTDYCQYSLSNSYDILIGEWNQGGTTLGSVADNSGNVNLELIAINGEATAQTTLEGFIPITGENLITWKASDTSGNETIYHQSITIERGACYKPGISGESISSNVLISTLNRSDDNSVTTKQNGILVLESKERGMVLSRIPIGESISNIQTPIEGMIVFDENDSCIKLYDGSAWACIQQKAISQP